MKGLIWKDIINLKRNVKIFGLLTVLYAFMAFTSKDASFFGSIFTMLFAILTMSTFSYDEAAKWDGYALTMPVTRENIVQSKYIMMLLLTLIGVVFSAGVTILLNIVLKSHTMFYGIQICIFGAALVMLFYSITIPIITKLGMEKARLAFFAVYLIPFFIAYIGKELVKRSGLAMPGNLITVIEFLVKYIYVIVPLVVVIALYISYMVSINIYKKKEF
ncbi:MAG: putative rane protein [Herbinix sp.]|jgi:ABC-type transport system involved in multi-copper enzyme maturation permease subunit|nr:putative rane protein [Herbinix sp.]